MAENIQQWLERIGIGQYAQAFAENGVDMRALVHLTEQDLKDLGVLLGHRRIILSAAAELSHPDAETQEETEKVESSPKSQAERRQVTILFADLSGYTALSTKIDAEEAHAILGRFFDRADAIIADHGGTVDKHIGDSVMAVFGAPLAHGNDPERAVRVALAIHEAMPMVSKEVGHRLAVHVGIASGQVVASGVGSDAHYTVTGESVNLASRLTDAAGSGETLMSSTVQRAVSELVEWEERGTFPVKGFADPVQAYAIWGLRSGAAAPRARPFVGRQTERQQFKGAMAVCAESGAGQAIYLRGEAGIGKTRLSEEFEQMAREQDFACHRVLVLDFGVGKGQDAIRALVRSFLAIPPGSGDAARAEAAEKLLADGLLEREQTVYLNDLLDIAQPKELRSLYESMDNATRIQGQRDTIALLLGVLAHRGPVLVIVEDIHWANQLILDHLAALTRALVDCPAILVMTSRIEGDPLDQTWRSSNPETPFMTIDMRPLRRDDAMNMAAEYFDATNKFALRCVERADGNPLFLEQLLSSADEAGDEQVPGSVQSIVQARMDNLDPLDKQAIQAASVLGQRFALDALRQLIDNPGYACAGLIDHATVRPDGELYLFTHALVRDGVYSSLLKDHRTALHGKAAAWYAERDVVLRAEHLDRANDPAAPAAYLDAAGAQSAALHFDTALRLTERGIELASDPATKCDLMCLRGDALHNTGAHVDAIAAFEGAVDCAEDDDRKCRAWIGMARGMRVARRSQEALATLDLAEAAAAKNQRAMELSQIHYMRGIIFFPLGNIEGCLDEQKKALHHASEAGSSEGEALALDGLGGAYYQRGHMRTACEQFRRCLEVCREHGYGRIEVRSRHMLGWSRYHLLEFREALVDGLEAAEMARTVSHHRADHRAEQHGFLAAAMVALELGKFEETREYLARALELTLLMSAKNLEAQAYQFLARLNAAQGDMSQARSFADRSLGILREVGMSFIGPTVLAVVAWLTEDPAKRKKCLKEAEDILDQGCVGHNHMWFGRFAIDAVLAAGEWDEAERYAARLEDYTREQSLAFADFTIARGRTLAALGRGKREASLVTEIKRLDEVAAKTGFVLARPMFKQALEAASEWYPAVNDDEKTKAQQAADL